MIIKPNISLQTILIFTALLLFGSFKNTLAQRTAFTAPKDTAMLEGFISSDTKLTPEKIYKINHNVKVGSDAVLSVGSGTKLFFAPNTSIVVEGGIDFTGEPNNFIELTSIDPGNQGIGILIRGNEGKDIVIRYCRFTSLKVPIKFDVEWFRDNVDVEKNEFRDLYTGESNILITSPFVSYDPTAGEQVIDFSFSQNSFINNWGSIFVENFEDNILDLSFTDNLITNNVVYGIDIGIPSNTPVFGLFDDTEGEYTAQISGNSIFGNYQINSSTDTIIREISFGIQGDGEEFHIPNNFFRSKNYGHISSSFDHFYQNSELPLLKPEPFLTSPKESAPPHIWKVLINGVEVTNYSKLPEAGRRDVSFEVHFNKPVLAYDETQLKSVFYDTLNNDLQVDQIQVVNTKWSSDKTVYSFEVNNATFMRNRLGYVVLTNFKGREGFIVPDFSIGQKSAINNYRRMKQGGLKTADLISGRGGIIDIEAAGGTYLPDERSVEAIEALTDFGDLSYLGPYRSLGKTWEVGIMAGFSGYMGTLNYKMTDPSHFHFAAGLFGQYNIDKWMSVRAMIWYGQISGNDFDDPDPSRSKRLANFKNHIVEGSLTFHWHLMKYGSSRGEKFTPTIFAGISIFRNNPVGRIYLYSSRTEGAQGDVVSKPVYLKYDKSKEATSQSPWVTDGSSGSDVWVPLRDIGTEGQTVGGIDPEGFRDGPWQEKFSTKKAPDQYRKVEIAFPLGVSLDYIIYNKWVISAELGVRVTLSKYLDDVSGYYWDRGSSYTQVGVDDLGNPIYKANRGESFETINGIPIVDQNGNQGSNEIIMTGAHQSIVDANPLIKDNEGRQLPTVLTVTDPNLLDDDGEPVSGVTATHSYYTAALLANPSLVEEDSWWADPDRESENPQSEGRNDAFREASTAKKGTNRFDHYGFFGIKVSKIITPRNKKKKQRRRDKVKIKDSDRDGISNDQEKYIGSDPKNEDTDGDGLPDGMEVNDIGSDPTKVDTDDDGLQDAREVNETSTNPTNSDTDGDRLSDGEEVTQWKTDPLNADTDGGGVIDGQEVLDDNTNPLSEADDKVDSDGDGVIDAQDDCPQEAGSQNLHGCPDSDNDGIENYLDKCPYEPGPKANGGCPEEEEVTEEQKKEVEEDIQRLFKNIEFDTGSDVIRSVSYDDLNTASDILRNYPQFNVIIEGHTDNVGNPVFNKTLSQKRADSVKKYLLNNGIEESRIIAVGYGEERPIASNLTESGRQMNRRVDVRLVKID